MKSTKYILVVAAVVAILMSAVWYLRNTLIQQISNPLLQDFGIVVTDVSLDAMATSDASIGHIVLEHKSGTTIVIENLTLPIRKEVTGSRSYAAGKISISRSSRLLRLSLACSSSDSRRKAFAVSPDAYRRKPETSNEEPQAGNRGCSKGFGAISQYCFCRKSKGSASQST